MSEPDYCRFQQNPAAINAAGQNFSTRKNYELLGY